MAFLALSALQCKRSKYSHFHHQRTGEDSNLHPVSFVDRNSIQLSYQCVFFVSAMRRGGYEPPASPLSGECSTSELTARVFHSSFRGRCFVVHSLRAPR